MIYFKKNDYANINEKMEKHSKAIEELEEEVSELRDSILDVGDIRDIVEDQCDRFIQDKEELYENIMVKVEEIVRKDLDRAVRGQVEGVKDELLIELARKAMGLEKHEPGGKNE